MFLLTSGGLGGAERVALDAMKCLSPHYDLTFVTPQEGDLRQAVGNKASFFVLPYGSGLASISKGESPSWGIAISATCQSLWYLLRLLILLIETRPHILYSHGLKGHLFATVAAIIGRRKLIWHLHLFPPAGRWRSLIRRLLRYPDALIANSHAVAEAYTQLSSEPNNLPPLSVLHCAIDPEDYPEQDQRESRQRLSLPISHTLVGMVGIFSRWKGFDVFLDAAAPLVKSRDDLTLLLCGDVIYQTSGHSDFYRELKNQIDELQIQERVIILPFQKEIATVYSACDFLVHASVEPEPFGRVVSEARACQRTIIASRAGGVLEQVEDQKTGILTAMGDRAELRNAIIYLLEHETSRKNLAMQGQKWVHTHLTPTVFCQRLRNIFSSLSH